MGLQIDVSYDSSVTSLQTTNPTLYNDFTSAVHTAVQYFESIILNPITVTINFGFGEIDGKAMSPGAIGQSFTYIHTVPYSSLYNALKAADSTSPVQRAAALTIPALLPGTWQVSTAEEEALGLTGPNSGATGWVGLDSTVPWSWNQSRVASGTYDAVGVLEHEITEVLGRHDTGGTNGTQTNVYQPLDLFRYTAAGGLANALNGAAVGVRDEPFMSNYNAKLQSYFSFNGTTVTLPYTPPAGVARGDDVADWGPVPNDSFDDVTQAGTANTISLTDLEEMNVMGYDFGVVPNTSMPLSASQGAGVGQTDFAQALSAARVAFDTSAGSLSVANTNRRFSPTSQTERAGYLALYDSLNNHHPTPVLAHS